jgi:hypothetical protein
MIEILELRTRPTLFIDIFVLDVDYIVVNFALIFSFENLGMNLPSP